MDYHSDSSRRRLSVLAQTTRLDLRKTAEAVDQAPPTDLPAQSFADAIGRRFPVHTKEALVLSAAYYFGGDEQSPRVEQQLEKAAAFWDAQEELQQLRQELRSRQQPKYALDLQIEGAVLRHFPWHDRPSLEKTAGDFLTNRQNLPRQARLKTAHNLLAAQQELQAQFDPEVGQYLDRCCGYGLPDMEKAAEMLLERSHRTRRQPESQPLVRKLAQVLQLLQDLPDADTLKIAIDAFSDFDEQTGLARAYGRGLELPEDQLTGLTVSKHASDTQGLVRLANGQQVRLSDIDWTKVAEFDPALAQAVGGSTEKAAEVLPTWPRPDADLLVEMLGLQTV